MFHFRIHGGLDPDEYKSYKESFDAFDWNNNGKISYTSLQVNLCLPFNCLSKHWMWPKNCMVGNIHSIQDSEFRLNQITIFFILHVRASKKALFKRFYPLIKQQNNN